MTPLQKRAWLGLVVGLGMALAILAVFLARGVASFDDDLVLRAIAYVLCVGGLLVYVVTLRIRRRKPGQSEVLVDERDKEIVRKATMAQLWAVLLSLFIWAIALTEAYWGQKSIPIVFVYLIAISGLIVSILAQAIGILIGYRRML
jgi:drug/metabolite transporter (DMT)-like permease